MTLISRNQALILRRLSRDTHGTHYILVADVPLKYPEGMPLCRSHHLRLLIRLEDEGLAMRCRSSSYWMITPVGLNALAEYDRQFEIVEY